MLVRACAFTLTLLAGTAFAASRSELARWERHARDVTITRDDWGIAHVHGKTDADAVFGMLYAQAEDDFPRVETNYLNALGRLAEAEGDSVVFRDLRMKLFVNPTTLRVLYETSPEWLKKLMDAFADGLNFYLHQHPEVKPRVLTRFEPWMALSFTEGSIGGDIQRLDLVELAALYGDSAAPAPPATGDGPAAEPDPAPEGPADPLAEPDGSNGIAIAPALTRAGHALLLINPHTSFYFRSELHVSSDKGLDAYGAVTWGQFFVYQGFNRTCGWMHTSSGVDNIDEFLEPVVKRGAGYVLRRGSEERPLRSRTVVVRYRTATRMAGRAFTVYETGHGPVVRRADGRWVSVALMREPVSALIQSYSRTKARDLAGFRKILELHTNSSNNTVFADAKGTVAYFHSNYIPRRDTTFDWRRPVDGGNAATDYRGVLSFDETPNVVSPASGWVYNSNNWPWSAAGRSSPARAAFPRYVETGVEETPRGYHALRVLEGSKDWTIQSLAAAAYDSHLPSFERLVPRLLEAYDRAPAGDPVKARVTEPIALLRGWDFRFGAASVPTSLAVQWGELLVRKVTAEARAARLSAQTYIAERVPPAELLSALAAATDTLTAHFGTWRTPWGEINRFQRLNAEVASRFDDREPSLPVPFTSGNWGSLASFGARPHRGTRKWYGTSGNSFVAVVEFAPRVRAVAVTAGGASGRRDSKHFADQIERYAGGNLREVYFHRDEFQGHVERVYHPGQ